MAGGGRALHPIVAALSPNDEQRRVLQRTRGDLVVTAGAGTGKTRTLVARYLELLAEGVPLRGIVAVTFTRKAAREMRNRVREAIRTYLEAGVGPPEDLSAWRGRYEGLDAARIDTLHGLCGEILRAHPAETGLDPRFTVLEEGLAGTLQAEAVRGALTWAADREDLAGLFEAWGDELQRVADVLLRRRLDVRGASGGPPEEPLATWRSTLDRWRAQALRRLTHSDVWVAAARTLRAARHLDPSDLLVGQHAEAVRALDQAEGDRAAAADHLVRLSEINLRGGRADAWEGGTAERDAVRDALRTLRELWSAHGDLLTLCVGEADETLAAHLPGLQRLFERVLGEYRDLKDERRALDYDDLEYLALELLRTCPAIRRRWQDEVQALLVDEFQDTNARQMELLDLLNDTPGKLFVVGDAKQSIYRFRGADVTVFRALCREARAWNGVLPLSASYRAHEALIHSLNALLQPALGERDDETRPWVEPFAPLRPVREEPWMGLTAPFVEVHLAIGSKGKGALDRAADAVGARLRELVAATAARVPDGDDSRPLDYGDMAILCRASGSFGAYEDALERAGLPFVTVAGRGFYERPEVRDVLNALCALADPADDVAVAGLLRSPAVGLSDGALYALCRRRAECATLWQVLGEAPEALEGEDAGRLGAALPTLRRLSALVGRRPVADVLKAFLDETGYRAALLHGGHRRAARNLSKLLDDARESGLVGVSQFLEYVRALRGTGAREGEARIDSEGAVQIMSVHAAKGLEFPVVILGDAGYEGGSRPERIIVDADLGVLPDLTDEQARRPAVRAWAEQRVREQDEAETARLLYVAATRAREMLLVSGCAALKKDRTLAHTGPWLHTLANALGLHGRELPCDDEGDGAHDLRLSVEGCDVACRLYEPRWQPAPRPRPPSGRSARPLPPTRPPLLDVTAPSWPAAASLDAVAERGEPPWRVVSREPHGRDEARLVGWLVHEALAAWRCRTADFERWAWGRAASRGIEDEALLDHVAARSKCLLARFAESDLFEEMSAAEVRLHEVPYGRVDGQGTKAGRIDALYRADGLWHVVEFKTDEITAPADLEAVLTRHGYVEQARRYVAAVRDLLGCEPLALLCLLDYCGRVSVHDLAEFG